MAPTICSGCSCCIAARSRVPGDSVCAIYHPREVVRKSVTKLRGPLDELSLRSSHYLAVVKDQPTAEQSLYRPTGEGDAGKWGVVLCRVQGVRLDYNRLLKVAD